MGGERSEMGGGGGGAGGLGRGGEREKEQEIEGGDGGGGGGERDRGGGGGDRESSLHSIVQILKSWNLSVCHLILIKWHHQDLDNSC